MTCEIQWLRKSRTWVRRGSINAILLNFKFHNSMQLHWHFHSTGTNCQSSAAAGDMKGFEQMLSGNRLGMSH
jgi:hypothetical protein